MNRKHTYRILFVIVAALLLGACAQIFTTLEDLDFSPNPYDPATTDMPVQDLIDAGAITDPELLAYAQQLVADDPDLTRGEVQRISSGDFPNPDPVLSTLEDLRLFPNIDDLLLFGSELADSGGTLRMGLEPLMDLRRLRYLELSSQNLTNAHMSLLDGSAWADLENLVLHDNNITDMGSLQALVEDIYAARGNDRLGLRVDSNPIDPATFSSVSAYADKLWGLSAPGQSFTDLEWIPDPTEWGFLDISSNPNIADATGMQHFVQMDNLYIWGTTAAVYNEAVTLPEMVYFNVGNLPPGTIDAQDIADAGWNELWSLGFSDDASLTDVSPIFALTSLGELSMNGLGITSVQGISNLQNLEQLELIDNTSLVTGVDDIANIASGTLRTIKLTNIGLTDSDPQVQAVIDAHPNAHIILPSGAELNVP